ncbi:hypothetical protein EHS25_005234 [Saitozyma podzolica]|uniref:Uncharacterized protein n=1 Tax=Saitozyma podzolica TaxID=1890683 RepID=A0A427XYR3_9TREE|nr:hypothetical protein EHS25_005234 [Saitozyma podzolica]
MSDASASASAVDSTSTQRPRPLLLTISDTLNSSDRRIQGESHIVLVEDSESTQEVISMTSPTGARRAIQRLGDIEGDDDNTDVSSLLNPTAATWKRVIEVIYKTRVGRDPWVQEYVLHDGHCVFEIFKDGELCSKPDGGRWRYSELGPAVASTAESLPRVTLQLLDHYSTQGSEPLGFTISFGLATKSGVVDIATTRTLVLPSTAPAA